MVWLVMLPEMFARTVKASFHRGDTGFESLGNLGMAPAFLDQRQQGANLRPQLRERVAERIELLGINRAGRLRNVFMFLPERQKNPPQLLPAKLIDAGVAREPEKPGLELRRSLQPIDGANHLDEHLLRQVLHVIASTGHGVNEASDSVLVTDDELALGSLVALLSPPHQIGQRSR